MQLKDPYYPRRIQFLEQLDAPWRLKIYSILHQSRALNPNLVEVAKETALAFLPQPAVTPNHYGVGFVSVHQGKSYDFVTVGYWTYDTELRHQTYLRPSSSSTELEVLTSNDLSLDVWDLRLLAFERDAWVSKVLRVETPNLEEYLASRLEEEL